MTKSKEILPQYRDKLETEIKDNYLGNRTKCYHGDDEDGHEKGAEFITIIQIIHPFPTKLHTRKKYTPHQSQIFRPEKGRRQNSGRRMETNTRSGKELRI